MVRDHPRSRGEYVVSRSLSVASIGSSPLSRGILLLPVYAERGYGIIPALAGNTMVGAFDKAGLKDHPRSRGEYTVSLSATARRLGSSPLSRGILVHVGRAVHPCGIIPALAGNT